MKLSKRTLEVLKNFSTINPSILFKQGNTLSTMAPSKKIIAQARTEESFPQDFGIYELNRLLGTLSLFSDPELTIGETRLTIQGEGRKVDYTYCEPESIVLPPKGLNFVSDASFKMSADSLKDVLKAAGVLSLTEIEFSGDGTTVRARAIDAKNTNTHAYTADLGTSDVAFRMVFKVEVFKFLPGDYDVEISLKKLARLTSADVTYYVAAEVAEAK